MDSQAASSPQSPRGRLPAEFSNVIHLQFLKVTGWKRGRFYAFVRSEESSFIHRWKVQQAINGPDYALQSRLYLSKGSCHGMRGVWSLRYAAGILSKKKNGGHHAIPHQKHPLEMIFSNFFQKIIFPLHT